MSFKSISARLATLSDDVIKINGREFRPDSSKAYLEFTLARALPVVVSDFSAIHPAVLARAWPSMKDTKLDINHIIRAYDPEENVRDRIVGAIIEVELVGSTAVVLKNREDAPHIRAVATLFKEAEGVERLMAAHLYQKPWSVSMEMSYDVAESGLLLVAKDVSAARLSDAERALLEAARKKTPDDLGALGYIYLAAAEAPKDLWELWTAGKGWKSTWNRLQPVFIEGGIDGTNIFRGAALTPRPKEKEAEISTMLAAEECDALWYATLKQGLQILK